MMDKKNKIIGSVIIVIIFCIFTIVGFIKDGKEENYDDIFVESKPVAGNLNNTTSDSSKYIKVEIKGEIQKPGVYSMGLGSRLEDLIYKAGGFTEKADKDRIQSLAKKLKDEECIIIPNKDTPGEKVTINNISTSDGDVININTADRDELEEIPGVGPVTAQKIFDYREKQGYFNSIEDLKNVDGIGDKTLDKMREKITVD